MHNTKYIKRVWSTSRLTLVADKLVNMFLYSQSENLDDLQEVLDVMDAAKDKLVFLRTKSLRDVESLR